MALQKLSGVDAFVVRDFDDDVAGLGIVRSAPKILQSGAKELARSQTYQCAILNMRCQGVSAGINAAPDARAAAIAAFVEELMPQATSGSLMLDPAKGVSTESLEDLLQADPRSDAYRRVIDGVPNRQHLTGLGSVIAVEAVQPLDGKRIAIDHFEVTGPAVARAAAERGAQITAISTSAGTATAPDGFDIAELAEALAANGADMVKGFADEPGPGWKLLGAEVDVLFAGSKMGLISHQGAPNVKATLLAPTGPIPYTTKGALMLEAQGTTVLPDFITTAGPLFAGMPTADDDQESIESSMTSAITSLAAEVTSGTDSAVLEACYRAESFLGTWRETLPFGRPFAP